MARTTELVITVDNKGVKKALREAVEKVEMLTHSWNARNWFRHNDPDARAWMLWGDDFTHNQHREGGSDA